DPRPDGLQRGDPVVDLRFEIEFGKTLRMLEESGRNQRNRQRRNDLADLDHQLARQLLDSRDPLFPRELARIETLSGEVVAGRKRRAEIDAGIAETMPAPERHLPKI